MVLAANNKPVAGWIFMILWLGMLGVFTGLFFRDGSPKGYEPYFPAVLGIFWLFGFGGGSFLLRIPRTTVRRLPGGQIAVTEHWLWTSKTELGPPRHITVEQHQDSDGEPYFHCYLETASGRRVSIHESHRREDAEQTRARLLQTLSL